MPTRRPRATFSTSAPLLLLAGACSGEKAKAQSGAGSRPPMPVETAVVSRQPVADRFEAIGTIEAGESITVVSEIDRTVVKLPFREGQRVERGAVIARLDDEQLEAELTRAEALLDQKRSTYERVKSLVDQGAGTPQDLDDAEAAMKIARAEVALARSRLAKTRITAPFSGLTGARRVSAGAFVRAGDAITSLADIEKVRVAFSVPERHLGKIRRGVPVTIDTTAFPGYELAGTVDIVEPLLDPGTRSTRVIAVAENPDGKLRPGMSAKVVALLSQRAEALTIPSEAVFVEGAQSLVYRVKKDGTVSRIPVTLGTRMASVVEVTGGLQEGDRIVRAGHQKLFEGARVAPVNGSKRNSQEEPRRSERSPDGSLPPRSSAARAR